jgi:hypothetical protein
MHRAALAVLGVVIGLSITPALAHPLAARPGSGSAVISVDVQWLRVDPLQPRTLYVGGSLCGGADTCASWIMRSLDAGTTWADLTKPIGADNVNVVSSLSPLVLSPDGGRLYAGMWQANGSPASTYSDILRSTDGGLHWQGTAGANQPGYGSGLTQVAVSPLSSNRLYAVYHEGESSAWSVAVSNDGGRGFTFPDSDIGHLVGDGALNVTAFVGDPTRPDTLYANIANLDFESGTTRPPFFAARSDDAGLHWTTVTTPTATPPLQSFAVTTDPHEGGMLVGYTPHNTGVPVDRRYLSTDQGRTWTVATCPGDAAGLCPAATVDNVFGDGASYAFVRDHIYRFTGSGPAGAALAISSKLPVHTADLIAAGAGSRAGDPVYLLARGTRDNVQGLLYRSTDAGRSWQRLDAGLLPNLAPPSMAPGTLYVAASHHSVAAPFVATYRQMSPLVLGNPVTEAYLEGAVLTQDFQHLRLELRGGHVVVGNLGADVLYYTHWNGYFAEATPVSNTATRRYFPSTHHLLQGDLLRFWQTHGGLAVFGAPLTDVIKEENGDGSGRVYELQWFEKARLERHPETHNPRYAILLGLLGKESLRGRHWAP